MTNAIDEKAPVTPPQGCTLFGAVVLLVIIVVLFFALRAVFSPRPQVLP